MTQFLISLFMLLTSACPEYPQAFGSPEGPWVKCSRHYDPDYGVNDPRLKSRACN